MSNAKPSIYPKEYRDQMAKECYEQLLENKTTIIQFSKENNIDTLTLYYEDNSVEKYNFYYKATAIDGPEYITLSNSGTYYYGGKKWKSY